MQRGLFFSLVLHLTVVVLAWVGLPNLADRKLVDDSPIVVEMVDVADKTNVPAPTPEPKKQPKKVETPPEPPKAKEPDVPKPPEPKSPPPAPTPPPEPKPAPPPKPEAKAEPAPAPEPKPKPEPKPEKKAEPVPKPDKKVPEKKPEKKAEPAPEPKPAPRLVTTTPPKKPKAPKAPEEFQVTSVLKTLEKIKKQQPQDSKDKPTEKKPKKAETPTPEKKPADDFAQRMREALANKQSKNFDPSAKVTQSEIDAVKRQLRRCWNPPPGGKNAEDMVISIELQMNPDGTVQRADIADKARMASDPFFRASAEAGLRAVLNPRCNPLKLPPDKYQQWQQITLNFNPKEMY